MRVASTQASRFVHTDGRSRALDGSRLARRSGVAPGAGNNTSWLGHWNARLGKLLQLKTMGSMNECPACWGQQAWPGVTTSNGRVSALDLRGVPGEKVDPGSVLGQNYLLETEATLLGWYHPAGWGTKRAHDLKKALLDWGRKVTASDRTGALTNRPLPHRIWGQHIHGVILLHYTRGENFGLHMCIPVGTDFHVGWVAEVCGAHHLGRDSEAHDIGPTCRSLEEATRNVVFSIIRNEVVVRAGHLYCDGLLVSDQWVSARVLIGLIEDSLPSL
jgi:hypothetical protein